MPKKGYKHPENCGCSGCQSRGEKHPEDCTHCIKLRSPEGRKKLSIALKGKKRTEETKNNISKSKQGKTHKGTPHTLESIQKIRDAKIGSTPWNKGMPRTEEVKQKLRDANLGKIQSEETRKKKREATKNNWQKPEYKKKQAFRSTEEFRARMMPIWLNNVQAAKLAKPTLIEVILFNKVKELFPNEEVVMEFKVGRKLLDVAIPSLKLDFEADGNYWHNITGAKKRDLVRDNWLRKQGWIIQRYTEDYLKSLGDTQIIIYAS